MKGMMMAGMSLMLWMAMAMHKYMKGGGGWNNGGGGGGNLQHKLFSELRKENFLFSRNV